MNNEIQQKWEELKNLRNYALSFTSDTCEEAVAFRVKRVVLVFPGMLVDWPELYMT